MRRAGWRMLLSPKSHDRRSHGFPYAIDNGAWTAYQQKTTFDDGAFRRLVASHGADADWIAVPDIVAGGVESLAFSLSWLPELRRVGARLLIPVQDGMNPEDVRPHVSTGAVGVFVGGSTEWKIETIPVWGAWAQRLGLWCHVGRVNTGRRIAHCLLAGVTSIDGSRASRYSKDIPFLDAARRQIPLFGPADFGA